MLLKYIAVVKYCFIIINFIRAKYFQNEINVHFLFKFLIIIAFLLVIIIITTVNLINFN